SLVPSGDRASGRTWPLSKVTKLPPPATKLPPAAAPARSASDTVTGARIRRLDTDLTGNLLVGRRLGDGTLAPGSAFGSTERSQLAREAPERSHGKRSKSQQNAGLATPFCLDPGRLVPYTTLVSRVRGGSRCAVVCPVPRPRWWSRSSPREPGSRVRPKTSS